MLIFKDSIKDVSFKNNCSTCPVTLSCYFIVAYNSFIVSPMSGQLLYYTGYLAKYNGMYKEKSFHFLYTRYEHCYHVLMLSFQRRKFYLVAYSKYQTNLKTRNK